MDPKPRLSHARSAVAVAGAFLAALAFASCRGPLSPEAHREFRARPKPLSLTILPIHVVGRDAVTPDADAARDLAAFLRERGLADAVVAESPVEVPVEWGVNEAGMFRRSAEAFARAIVDRRIATDYALLVEFLFSRPEGPALAVHAYVVDRGGRLAEGILRNSHQPAYQDANPVDRPACLRMTKAILERRWGLGDWDY
jgi:hypothetical protein